jgi:hypothetical protein
MSHPTCKPIFSPDQTDYHLSEGVTQRFDSTLSTGWCLFNPVSIRFRSDCASLVISDNSAYRFLHHDVAAIKVLDTSDNSPGATQVTIDHAPYTARVAIRNTELERTFPRDAGDQSTAQASGSSVTNKIRPNRVYEENHRRRKKRLENLLHKAIDVAFGSQAGRQGLEYLRIATELIK